MVELIVQELREEGRDIARHEAGHYTIARALGHRTDEVFILCNFGGSGTGGSSVTIDQKLASMDEVVRYLEDRVLILYAGAMAENVVNGQVDDARVEDNLKGQSKDDYSKLRENLRTIACIKRDPSEDLQGVLDRVTSDLRDRARALVVRFDADIDALADELLNAIEAPGLKAVVNGWTRPELGCARLVGGQTP